MSDGEIFTRLSYFGRVQLGFSELEAWLSPISELLDLMACHWQWHGIENPYSDPFEDLILGDIDGV